MSMRLHGRDLSGVFRLPRAVEAWMMTVHVFLCPQLAYLR